VLLDKAFVRSVPLYKEPTCIHVLRKIGDLQYPPQKTSFLFHITAYETGKEGMQKPREERGLCQIAIQL